MGKCVSPLQSAWPLPGGSQGHKSLNDMVHRMFSHVRKNLDKETSIHATKVFQGVVVPRCTMLHDTTEWLQLCIQKLACSEFFFSHQMETPQFCIVVLLSIAMLLTNYNLLLCTVVFLSTSSQARYTPPSSSYVLRWNVFGFMTSDNIPGHFSECVGHTGFKIRPPLLCWSCTHDIINHQFCQKMLMPHLS